MSQFNISWTPFALKCLDDIFEYIRHETKSIEPAQKFTDQIIDRTFQLESFPFSGQEEPLLSSTGQDARYLIEGNYKIIYQIEKHDIIITDIFHVKQNPVKIKKRSKK